MAVIDLTQLVAQPSYAPGDWQSGAPRDAYSGLRPPVQPSAELDRVLNLPRRGPELDATPRAEAIIDVETERYSNGVRPGECRCAQIDPDRHAKEGCISRLRLVQAMALRELSIVGGLGGPIGVGHGKTLLDLLAPLAFAHHARATGTFKGELLCVLLVPPKLVEQLARDYDYISQHFVMPSMIVQGNPDLDRVRPGSTVKLQVMPYSRLSRKEATVWLRVVQPHAIIADECHKLRDSNTATTSRVMRYFDEFPGTRFACWSGSFTSKSIKDYAHLLFMALKYGSPMPREHDVVEDWARAIDPSKNPADPGPLLEGLIHFKFCLPGESLYAGVRRRVLETIGVVSTRAPAVDCELEILERMPDAVPSEVQDMIYKALAFERPDGEEFVTAMQAVECACQLACGFYYRWIYPHNEFPRDTMLVLDWLLKRKAWHKELRQKLKSREEHLDSPQLCEYAAQRALGLRPVHKGLPVWPSMTYAAWHDIKSKVRPVPDPVRVDDWLVRDVIDWASDHHGIVWYHHAAFGEWVSEVAARSGLVIPVYGAGDEAKAHLLGDPRRGIPGERGDRSVLCSMKAHGTGTNGLQFVFSDQLFTNLPADPAAYEQTLGRTHRSGQPAKAVRAWFYLHTGELRKHVSAALRASNYIEGTGMGSDQKLRLGFPLDIELEDDEE